MNFGIASCATTPSFPPKTLLYGRQIPLDQRKIRIGNDFYEFVNGAFEQDLRIPDDHPSYGVSEILTEEVDKEVRNILDTHDVARQQYTSDVKKAQILYRTFMNQQQIDAVSTKPLSADLNAIAETHTRSELAALMGTSVRNFQASLIGVSVTADPHSPNRHTVIIGPAGLGMPDYNLYSESRFTGERTEYRKYIASILALTGGPQANAQADAVLAFETKIADANSKSLDSVDEYDSMTTFELTVAAPGIDWFSFLNAVNVGSYYRICVENSIAISRIASIYASTPPQTLKAWAVFHLVDNASPNLGSPLSDAGFAFHNRALAGQSRQLPRWERGVTLVNNIMGDAVGHAYTNQYFTARVKEQIASLVKNLREAFAARIEASEWLSSQTKQRALHKLSQLKVKIGYPDRWTDYSDLQIRDGDLYGDIVRAMTLEWVRQRARLDQPVDDAEWDIAPQATNAYYKPSFNEVVIPAAVLRPPYFDSESDLASNYGEIGAFIGHEMSHGFDEDGHKFDGTGAMVDWWTEKDEREFSRRTALLAAQYNCYEVSPGLYVNGILTSAENTADLGGVLIALDAYHRAIGNKPAPIINGLTGDQRFFVAFARSWQEKRRNESLRTMVAFDSHAPERYRVNGVLRNVDAWYTAFAVRQGDKLYLHPSRRVHIW